MPGVEFCEEKSSKVSIDCAHDVGPCVVWAGECLNVCVCVCVCVSAGCSLVQFSIS